MTVKRKGIIATGILVFLAFGLLFFKGNTRHKKVGQEKALIAASGGTWCAIENDSLKVWGEWNSASNLAYEHRETVFEKAASVWGGRFSILVLDDSGDLWTNSKSGHANPDKIGIWEKVLSDVAFARVGLWNSIAVKTDGSLWIWGQNDKGQLGNGEKVNTSQKFPPIKLMDDVYQAETTGEITFAITHDGTLYGIGEWNQWINPISIAKGVKSITYAPLGWEVLMSDGTLCELLIQTQENGATAFKLKDIGVSSVIATYANGFKTKDGKAFFWDYTHSKSFFDAEKVEIGENVDSCVQGLDGFLILTGDNKLLVVDFENEELEIKEIERRL